VTGRIRSPKTTRPFSLPHAIDRRRRSRSRREEDRGSRCRARPQVRGLIASCLGCLTHKDIVMSFRPARRIRRSRGSLAELSRRRKEEEGGEEAEGKEARRKESGDNSGLPCALVIASRFRQSDRGSLENGAARKAASTYRRRGWISWRNPSESEMDSPRGSGRGFSVPSTVLVFPLS